MSRAARLGLFVVATLAILVAGIFIIGNKQYLFSSTYQVKAQFDNVAGLDAGADVRVGGVHSGAVRSILLPHRPGEQVTIVMDLNRSTHEIIKQDSVATIETEGLLGNQYMAISFGSAGSADVHNGDLIASLPPLQMSEMLAKASSVLDSSKQAVENVTEASANLNSITGKVNRGEGTVGALVNDRALYNSLQQSTNTMHATMLKAQSGATGFNENMEALKHNFLLRGFFKNRGFEDASEVGKNAIGQLPAGAPLKEFTYSVEQLFDKQDSAKLKNEKSLRGGGEFLAGDKFGVAVITVSAGEAGDSAKELLLSEARAMVVRDYLVAHFGFDDTNLKTMGTGKQAATKTGAPWGTVQILIYPVGTQLPHGARP